MSTKKARGQTQRLPAGSLDSRCGDLQLIPFELLVRSYQIGWLKTNEGLGAGDWGLGTGDWGLGTGDWGRESEMRGQWAGKCGGVSVIFCDFRERICRLSCGQNLFGFGHSLC